MITRVQLPSNAELMPTLPPPPAQLVTAVEQAEYALNAVRAKRRDYELANNDRAREAFYNELRPAIVGHAAAVGVLAEYRRQQALQLLAELRAELAPLEAAYQAADVALRSQQRRIELIGQIAQSAQAEMEDAQRRERMVAPAQPVRGDSPRIHIGQASTQGVSVWT